jgi:hypothetical protein
MSLRNCRRKTQNSKKNDLIFLFIFLNLRFSAAKNEFKDFMPE